MTAATARFRDRRAIVVWLFALLWDAAVALLGVVVWTEPANWKGLLAVAVFGLAGLGLSIFALKSPLLGVDVTSSSMTVTRRFPLRRRREVFPISEVLAATVVEEHVADSDPSYVCRIELRRAPPIDLFGKVRRASAEAEVARFNAAAGTATAFTRASQRPPP